MEKQQNKTRAERSRSVPQVRFPEFEEEWEVKKLGDICDINPKINGLPNTFIYIDLESVKKGELLKESKISKQNSPSRAQRLLKKEDILFQTVRPYQMNNYYFNKSNDSYVASTGYAQLRTFQHSKFIYFSLHLNKFVNKVLARCTGTSYPAINSNDLAKIKLPFPTLSEQQKIAHFFSITDKKLTQLQEKKTALELYKKGITQQIFSQQLRFKDDNGKDFPEWEVKKLGEVSFNVMYGMNASATKFDGINKYIRITDIDESSRKYVPNPITSPKGKLEEKYKLSEGDILFTRTGASVGKSYLYEKDDGVLHFAGFLIRFSIKEANPYFIFLQTLTEKYNKWVVTMSMRSGQPGINANEFKSFPIQLPSIKEQTKIANFLSKIDDKINTVNEQIEITKTYKKGLLQKMFV